MQKKLSKTKQDFVFNATYDFKYGIMDNYKNIFVMNCFKKVTLMYNDPTRGAFF